MPTALTYLFDPLCGWCYGAAPLIQALSQHPDVTLTLAPTGLFAGTGRTLDAEWAAYAWSNDQRIAQLTGQRFTEAYRLQVLGRHGGRFDSLPTTLALAAVGLSDPARELAVLHALQAARYVQGQDTCEASVVEALLRDLGLGQAADRFAAPDEALAQACDTRMQQARRWMQILGARGVPAVVVHGAEGDRLLHGAVLYGAVDPRADGWLERLLAAR